MKQKRHFVQVKHEERIYALSRIPCVLCFSIISKERKGKKDLLPSVILLCSRSCILSASFDPFFQYTFLQMHAGTVQLRRIAKKYKRKIVFFLGYS